ncbi:DUF397 domain-containing protein [Thermomonospora amylolytica]|uniref:DUF397 domain-containing protein n=1 Tax=Thermomonospora amylolytica TaxID=1411117 RepID=UPI0018E532B0|nr:DUF397 domain-containing protein [Thermomonospora amylolytica]
MAEVGWRISTRCANGNCVAVAALPGGRVAMRDTKRGAHGPLTVLPADVWRTFVERVKNGEYDPAGASA